MKAESNIVDWEEVKRRLATTQRMLADDFQPSAAEQARILERRAQELARIPAPESPGDEREVLEFSIAGERFAFESAWVSEIVVLGELTALPCTPPFVRGVVNMRGRIVSAIDLRRLFGLPDKGIVDFHRIIVLSTDGMEFGVLADQVEGVARIRMGALQRGHARETACGMLGEFAMGIMARDAAPLTMLDAKKLLHDRRMLVDLELQA